VKQLKKVTPPVKFMTVDTEATDDGDDLARNSSIKNTQREAILEPPSLLQPTAKCPTIDAGARGDADGVEATVHSEA
jgi:hypothetical protein